jgi:hypothetical protein
MFNEKLEIKEEEKEKFIENPIQLHPELTLQNEDIEDEVSPTDWPKDTICWKQRDSFPSFHLNPEARLLLIFMLDKKENPDYKAFRLKASSQLLEKYKIKYGTKSALA